MGLAFEMKPGQGPYLANPVRSAADVEAVRVPTPKRPSRT